jgi:zinc protease
LELFSLVLTKPQFNETDFQRERRKVEVKLLQQKDDPEELAELAFEKIIFGNQNTYAFPVLGFDETISQLNTNDVKTFYRNHFNPVSSYLIAAGNISEGNLVGLLEKSIGGWQNKQSVIVPKFESKKNKRAIYILPKEGAVQTEIRIGHQAPKRNAPDFFAKTLMNMILGGQFTSRINLNLREAKGFTYGATSNFSYTKNAAEFCISTSVSTENTLAAVSEILFELEKIKHGVTKQEFELAQSSITRRFPANFESDGQVLANLAMIAIHNLPLDYFNTYVENILAVSPEQVKDAAVNNIKLDELSIVLVGDKNKLLEEFLVKSAGEVKVINQRGEKIE